MLSTRGDSRDHTALFTHEVKIKRPKRKVYGCGDRENTGGGFDRERCREQ